MNASRPPLKLDGRHGQMRRYVIAERRESVSSGRLSYLYGTYVLAVIAGATAGPAWIRYRGPWHQFELSVEEAEALYAADPLMRRRLPALRRQREVRLEKFR